MGYCTWVKVHVSVCPWRPTKNFRCVVPSLSTLLHWNRACHWPRKCTGGHEASHRAGVTPFGLFLLVLGTHVFRQSHQCWLSASLQPPGMNSSKRVTSGFLHNTVSTSKMKSNERRPVTLFINSVSWSSCVTILRGSRKGEEPTCLNTWQVPKRFRNAALDEAVYLFSPDLKLLTQ